MRERERKNFFLCRWMGVEGNETTLTVIEKFANQNYAYGREWLTSQVQLHHIIIHSIPFTQYYYYC